jgi:ubiquinol-cytochrome c reductase cytochrome b subunit
MAATSPAQDSRIKRLLVSVRWGGHSLVCLYISVLSGIVIALQYNAHEALYSTTTIELVVPFGSFWRAMHYYSSQAFFLLLLVHLVMILWKNDSRFTRSAWLRLSASIPVALLLLFTGYVLRGDATGEAAGAIAEHITLAIPAIGDLLNAVLFDIDHAGLRKVYTNHLIGLMVLGGFCVWPHLRRYTASWRNHLPVTLAVMLLAAVLVTPMEPDRFGLLHIAGPWFFLGLQEVLRYMPAFWAGVVLPATLVIPLLLLPAEGRQRRACLWFMVFWLLGYAVLSWFSYARIEPLQVTVEVRKAAPMQPVKVVIPETLQ